MQSKVKRERMGDFFYVVGENRVLRIAIFRRATTTTTMRDYFGVDDGGREGAKVVPPLLPFALGEER